MGYKGIYIYQSLDLTTPERIKYITERQGKLIDDVGIGKEESDFKEVLLVCNMEFKEKNTMGNVYQKIYIFTANDVPNVNENEKREASLNYAKVL